MVGDFEIFDCHLHIIDKRFPLVPNQGYLPNPFTGADYWARMAAYDIRGGAIVSGSFQAFDQSYLLHALETLGPSFVGVTQLPSTVTDATLLELHKAGVRAIRFNLKRGGSEGVQQLSYMASRVHDLVDWHVELYVDSKALSDIYPTLIHLPAVSIDHLGLSKAGLRVVIKLAEKGVRIKATGFSRVNFDVKSALKDVHSANPNSLMFGTDLPSTRAPKPYDDHDALVVIEALGCEGAKSVFSRNAINFYKLSEDQ